ncbi:MAG: hypothetical protein ACRDZ4_13345 [Egibacteraceae bacterium]
MSPTPCIIDVHPNVFDLTGELIAEFFNTVATDPVGVVHEDQTLKVKVTVTLHGRILHYLCNTELCVSLAFESCGSGPEGEFTKWQKLDPCRTNVYTFEFDLPGGVLKAGECGKQYKLCITLGSKDCCGKVGFIFGTCKDFTITVLPADVSGTPAP